MKLKNCIMSSVKNIANLKGHTTGNIRVWRRKISSTKTAKSMLGEELHNSMPYMLPSDVKAP